MPTKTQLTDADRSKMAHQAAAQGVNAIAKKAGVEPDTVRQWMRKFGVNNVPCIQPSAIGDFSYQAAVGMTAQDIRQQDISAVMLEEGSLNEDQFESILLFAADEMADQMNDFYCMSTDQDYASPSEVYEAGTREGDITPMVLDPSVDPYEDQELVPLHEILVLRDEDIARLRETAIGIFAGQWAHEFPDTSDGPTVEADRQESQIAYDATGMTNQMEAYWNEIEMMLEDGYEGEEIPTELLSVDRQPNTEEGIRQLAETMFTVTRPEPDGHYTSQDDLVELRERAVQEFADRWKGGAI